MNYFNYFTEIEERFQGARGRQIYLSPLDWALIESWKEAGIPLSAVLEGIDQAFAPFQSGRRKDTSRPRALAYCAAAVIEAAEAAREAAVGGRPEGPQPEPPGLGRERIRAFLLENARRLRAAEVPALARQVARDAAQAVEQRATSWEESPTTAGLLQDLDRWLTALDDRLHAALLAATPTEMLAEWQAAVEREIAPYRRQMKTEQTALVMRQFLHKRLLEHYRMPRLSLFYMR